VFYHYGKTFGPTFPRERRVSAFTNSGRSGRWNSEKPGVCFRPTAVIRESRPLWRCWLGSRQYREHFTYADLRMKPLCALRPQTNTSSICLNYGVTLTPSLSGKAKLRRGLRTSPSSKFWGQPLIDPIDGALPKGDRDRER